MHPGCKGLCDRDCGGVLGGSGDAKVTGKTFQEGVKPRLTDEELAQCRGGDNHTRHRRRKATRDRTRAARPKLNRGEGAAIRAER